MRVDKNKEEREKWQEATNEKNDKIEFLKSKIGRQNAFMQDYLASIKSLEKQLSDYNRQLLALVILRDELKEFCNACVDLIESNRIINESMDANKKYFSAHKSFISRLDRPKDKGLEG